MLALSDTCQCGDNLGSTRRKQMAARSEMRVDYERRDLAKNNEAVLRLEVFPHVVVDDEETRRDLHWQSGRATPASSCHESSESCQFSTTTASVTTVTTFIL